MPGHSLNKRERERKIHVLITHRWHRLIAVRVFILFSATSPSSGSADFFVVPFRESTGSAAALVIAGQNGKKKERIRMSVCRCAVCIQLRLPM